MAENTKIWPIFRWANWGLSDDLFTGIKNAFYFSNDMEIREDAKSIFPKKLPAYADSDINVECWTGYDTCKSVTLSDNDWWIVCWLKKVYSVSLNTRVVTLLCTFSEEICDLEIFNWYVYISTKTHLYYKQDNWYYRDDMAAATDDSLDEYGVCSETLQQNTNHPLYASDICLCVWNCHKLMKVTKETPTLLEDWFEIQKNYFIRFINELGWFVRVTAVDEPYGSEVLFWDKVSDAAQEIIPLEWYSMLWSIIFKWYHYLLSNRGLGLLNWYQYYLLKKAEWDLSTSVRNCMCIYDDKLFFVTKDKLYIYWAKNKNYADVLSVWHECEEWYSYWAIWAYIWGILVSRNGKYQSNWIMVGLNQWKAVTGEVQTMCYYWTSMSEIKQSAYLRVWYHLPKEWTNSWNIHIYYRTEADATTDNPDDWSWHPVQENDIGLSAARDMRSPFATTLKLNCRFQWIQFKFVLTNCVYTVWADTLTKDTNLYSADLYYNVMLD